MRVAFLCDIHGNRMALEAVLPELERRGPFDAIVGGGDYVSRGTDDPGVVALLREAGWTVLLRGNNEDRLIGMAIREGRLPDSAGVRTDRNSHFTRYTLEHLSDADLDFLARTESTWQVTGPSGAVLFCTHAVPSDPYRHVWPDAPESEVNALLEESGADVYLYGHIHLNYVRRTSKGLIANAGTVGGPNRDENRHPVFMIAGDDGGGWRLQYASVPYDVDRYLKELAESDVPVAGDLVEAHLSHQWDVG